MAADAGRLMQRTAGCGTLTEADAAKGREVVLTGWVHRRRDLGRLIFVEMRDATGRVQVVFDPDAPEIHALAEKLHAEDVIGVRGTVVLREAPNPQHPTGTIEVRAADTVLHNPAVGVPFPVDDETEVGEELRLQHRYIDLRRPKLQRALRLRHRIAAAARAALDAQGFVEIETPMLTRSTPEGARDYLVPSRVHPGHFYALPQSPQLFKQLLMVAGFERYYQFARCFRDEDLRADRQPEFTQIDLEMSFASPDTIYGVIEPLVQGMFQAIGVEVAAPFPRMPYDEAMRRFGVDRPDTRFGLELMDAGPRASASGFAVFDDALGAGGEVRGIAVPGAGGATRKQLDAWTASAREAGAKGLVWIRREASGATASSALKILGEERCRDIAAAIGATPGDAALIVADRRATVERVLGTLRLKIAAELGLIPAGRFDLLWVEGFPMFQWDEGEGRFLAMHHPFTAPRWEEVPKLASEPAGVTAQAYDLVLNGTEIAGGSIRIHRRDVQDLVFRALSIGTEEAESKFGFLLRALQSGAPPHGGIALGFDRICAMLAGAESIRDVIAFPKTTSATDLMCDAPAEVDLRQLKELRIEVARPREDKA
ncbi:MAG TPA: aspartate--tRNA ligase [Candidatus Polarisedimenticolaceae bacterium]|nr:aspartate--tRNA ligase [Candidatus Polarisedimenticolaceae bacterium]